MTGIKQSDFTVVTSVDDADNIPLFTSHENKRISYENLRAQLSGEIEVRFIYPTIAQLQQSGLEADEDEPNYVRCEETEYRLYKITSLAVGIDDIALANGRTASYQEEYSKSGFVLGPASSTNNALALFDGATGAQLKTGAVLSAIGGNLASAVSIAQVSYPRVGADNSVAMATPTTVKTDLNLPANTALSISTIEGDISTIEGDISTIEGDIAFLDDNIQIQIETWADIATVTPTAAGQLFTLKQHTSGGLGGGTLMAFVGSVTDDGGTKKNCLGGFYLKRINIGYVTPEMFGAIGDGVADDTNPMQLAINAVITMGGGEVHLQEGTYKLSDSLTVNTGVYNNGVIISGVGRNSIIRQTGANKDCILFSTTQFLQNSGLRDIQVLCDATAGHCINILYGCTSGCFFENVEITQLNPVKALFYGDYTSFGGGIYDTRFIGGSWYCAPSSTEAGFRIKANGTIFNENLFKNIRCYNSNTLQFFHISTDCVNGCMYGLPGKLEKV